MSDALMTRNILRHYRAADDSAVVEGREWYDLAFTRCEQLAWRHGHTVTQAVAALAHLSPRVQWERNVVILGYLLDAQGKPPAVLRRSWEAALRAVHHDDPLATFSRRALKTASFTRAILGDPNAVAVDTWAARVAGVDPYLVRNVGMYRRLEAAYRRAGRIAGERAREMQAITWVHIRPLGPMKEEA